MGQSYRGLDQSHRGTGRSYRSVGCVDPIEATIRVRQPARGRRGARARSSKAQAVPHALGRCFTFMLSSFVPSRRRACAHALRRSATMRARRTQTRFWRIRSWAEGMSCWTTSPPPCTVFPPALRSVFPCHSAAMAQALGRGGPECFPAPPGAPLLRSLRFPRSTAPAPARPRPLALLPAAAARPVAPSGKAQAGHKRRARRYGLCRVVPRPSHPHSKPAAREIRSQMRAPAACLRCR